jgi:hypothetical protein
MGGSAPDRAGLFWVRSCARHVRPTTRWLGDKIPGDKEAVRNLGYTAVHTLLFLLSAAYHPRRFAGSVRRTFFHLAMWGPARSTMEPFFGQPFAWRRTDLWTGRPFFAKRKPQRSKRDARSAAFVTENFIPPSPSMLTNMAQGARQERVRGLDEPAGTMEL